MNNVLRFGLYFELTIRCLNDTEKCEESDREGIAHTGDLDEELYFTPISGIWS